jgi:hypothetical protein
MRSERGVVRTIGEAGLLLLALATGAHIVWQLLSPLLPTLLGICLTAAIVYWILGRRA